MEKKTLTEKYREKIDEIMESFDFESVHNHMKKTKWKWGMDDNTPTIGELKEEASRMLNDLVDDDLIFVSTGGFTAIKYKGDEWARIDLFFSSADTMCFDCIEHKFPKRHAIKV